MITLLKNTSDSQIIAMLEENNPLVWEVVYDKYAVAIYGMVCNLIDDLDVAEKILTSIFVKLKENHLLAGIKFGLCANLLRITYSHTIKQLKLYGFQPKTIQSVEEVKIIRLLCTHCTSIKDVALILNQSEEEVKNRLRSEFLNFRNATTNNENLTKQPVVINFLPTS